MNHLQHFHSYIKESITDAMVLQPGHVLFHSTIEEFEAEQIRGGGYDGVVWTAEDSSISQSYIPVSGSSRSIHTCDIIRPSKAEDIQRLQYQIGIVYDYSKVTYDDWGNPSNYRTPTIFQKFVDDEHAAWTAYSESQTKAEDLEKSYYEISEVDGAVKEEIKRVGTLYHQERKRAAALEKEWKSLISETKKCDYINTKMQAFGYKPKREDLHGNNHFWMLKCKYIDGKSVVLRGDFREKGRLMVLTAKEPIRIFDYAGDRDGDLMDLDYHKVSLFRKAEEQGYDGIRITDFAQLEDEGNIGHISFGIFPGSAKKFSIEVVHGVEHPAKGEYMAHKGGKWHSPEYLAHFNKPITEAKKHKYKQ